MLGDAKDETQQDRNIVVVRRFIDGAVNNGDLDAINHTWSADMHAEWLGIGIYTLRVRPHHPRLVRRRHPRHAPPTRRYGTARHTFPEASVSSSVEGHGTSVVLFAKDDRARPPRP
jgi:hypothetical protein